MTTTGTRAERPTISTRRSSSLRGGSSRGEESLDHETGADPGRDEQRLAPRKAGEHECHVCQRCRSVSGPHCRGEQRRRLNDERGMQHMLHPRHCQAWHEQHRDQQGHDPCYFQHSPTFRAQHARSRAVQNHQPNQAPRPTGWACIRRPTAVARGRLTPRAPSIAATTTPTGTDAERPPRYHAAQDSARCSDGYRRHRSHTRDGHACGQETARVRPRGS